MSWIYDDWRGPLYSRETKKEHMLAELSRVFSVVEIDATFFGIPRHRTLAGWAQQTTDDFRFTAKLPHSVTHEKRLLGDAAQEALTAAQAISAGLGEKLAALLVQLPPDLDAGERRPFEAFFSQIAGVGIPFAVELRHSSWQNTDIAAFLAEKAIALVTTEKLDFGHAPTYLRLLGEDGAVERFGERQFDRRAELDGWAERLEESPDALVFVRNFFEGHAPASLFYLMERLGTPPPIPPGQQQMSLF
jgi:uncharacterized protein YecE (DUF72 family)